MACDESAMNFAPGVVTGIRHYKTFTTTQIYSAPQDAAVTLGCSTGAECQFSPRRTSAMQDPVYVSSQNLPSKHSGD
jgi:hypothetical protein